MKIMYLLPLVMLLSLNAFVLLLRINAVVEYVRNEEDDNFVISLFTLKGVFRYKYEMSLMGFGMEGLKFRLVKDQGKGRGKIGTRKEKMSISGVIEKFDKLRQYSVANKALLSSIKNYIKNRLVFKRFNLKIEEGAKEADQTGIICGLLWSAAGILLSLLSNNLKCSRTLIKQVEIKPNFSRQLFNVDLKCIFHMRVVHIIVLLMKIYGNSYKEKRLKKLAKGKKEKQEKLRKRQVVV
jgi:hypothetical protein